MIDESMDFSITDCHMEPAIKREYWVKIKKVGDILKHIHSEPALYVLESSLKKKKKKKPKWQRRFN